MITRKQLLVTAMSFFFSCTALMTEAKVWRVNNNTGVSADFTQIQQAINSSSVVAGDTLYLEGSATSYTWTTLTKPVTIIGTGYLLSGAGSNAGLQANPNVATIQGVDLDSRSSGAVFIGVSIYVRTNSDVNQISFIRSSVYIDPFTTIPNTTAKNWIINKCMFGTGNLTFPFEDLQITNSLAVYGQVNIPNITNGLIRNNVFAIPLTVSNSYISNNIFLSTLNQTSCTVKYNISNQNNLPTGNNNQVNVSEPSIFLGTGSNDGRYQLRAGSPAIAAGEPINGVTPDIGAFGTDDPYRLSGIPPIPTIYQLTVPSSIPATATNMTITFSTRSNN